MGHWYASSCLGFIITGQWRPFCAAAYTSRDCAARRMFIRATDAWFHEDGHARKIALIYAVGNAIR